MVGSGEEMFVPVDTVFCFSVLEVLNTSGSNTVATVDIVGPQTRSLQLALAPYASQHIVLDELLGPVQLGYARVSTGGNGRVAAVAMHYGRRTDLGISYMFGVPAKPALGSELKGSYNTYLGQDTWLLTVSPSEQSAQISMVRPDGSERHAQAYQLRGVHALHLNQFEEPGHYGTVRVRPENRNTIVSWALRVKGDEYIIPTPLR